MDFNGDGEGEVENGPRVGSDPDAVESDPGKADLRVGGVEEESGAGDEEEEEERGGVEDAAAATAVGTEAVGGEQNDDVLGVRMRVRVVIRIRIGIRVRVRVRVGVGGKGRVRDELVLPGHLRRLYGPFRGQTRKTKLYKHH